MKRIKRLTVLLLSLSICYAVYYCWVSFPIATGYGAKVLGSAVFVSGRDAQQVLASDLDFFPVSLVTFEVNRKDSSVTCSMFGFAKNTAIWRRNAGVTLVNDIDEENLRQQTFSDIPLPSTNPDTVLWPMGDKPDNNFPAHVNFPALQQASSSLFIHPQSNSINETRALIVVYDGKIVIEKYGLGFSRNTRLAGWSMTKSVTSALIGILIKEGRLHVDAAAPVEEWNSTGDDRRNITIKNLLQQTSGLDFEEAYDRDSDANRMLFRKGNAAAYTASLGIAAAPGKVFNYSSGNSNLLSRIIRNVTGPAYNSFPYRSLFHATGMYSAILEPDASGTFVGSSFCYATARDWARFGLLYLQDGIFNGKRILPEGWVKASVTPCQAAPRGEYGYQWWLNTGPRGDTNNCIYPTLPHDMFFADGYEGQNIFIIPSKKLVVVRLGLTRRSQWGETEFIRNLIAAIP